MSLKVLRYIYSFSSLVHFHPHSLICRITVTDGRTFWLFEIAFWSKFSHTFNEKYFHFANISKIFVFICHFQVFSSLLDTDLIHVNVLYCCHNKHWQLEHCVFVCVQHMTMRQNVYTFTQSCPLWKKVADWLSVIKTD